MILMTAVEREYSQESNFDENEPGEPPAKKRTISYGR